MLASITYPYLLFTKDIPGHVVLLSKAAGVAVAVEEFVLLLVELLQVLRGRFIVAHRHSVEGQTPHVDLAHHFVSTQHRQQGRLRSVLTGDTTTISYVVNSLSGPQVGLV